MEETLDNTQRMSPRLATKLLTRVNHRARWWPLGIFPIRSDVRLSRCRIGNTAVSLRFPPGEASKLEAECRHIFVDDPYRLQDLARNDIRTVMDVGANVGFFSLLARHYFPSAVIHAYEPNPDVLPYLRVNIQGLNITAFAEAVGRYSGSGRLGGPTDDSLNRTVEHSQDGPIPFCSFSEAVARVGGGIIDLVKADCEGAEWELLEDSTSIERVRYLTMEYHLEHQRGRSLITLLTQIKDLGFRVEYLRESVNPNVGLMYAVNERLCS